MSIDQWGFERNINRDAVWICSEWNARLAPSIHPSQTCLPHCLCPGCVSPLLARHGRLSSVTLTFSLSVRPRNEKPGCSHRSKKIKPREAGYSKSHVTTAATFSLLPPAERAPLCLLPRRQQGREWGDAVHMRSVTGSKGHLFRTVCWQRCALLLGGIMKRQIDLTILNKKAILNIQDTVEYSNVADDERHGM